MQRYYFSPHPFGFSPYFFEFSPYFTRILPSAIGSEGNIFIRIGKSLIINRSYIYYINVPKQKLTLSDVSSFSHSVTASKEALKQLKELPGKGGGK